MTINLKGTALELTPEISDYLHKRLQAVEKFLPKGNDGFMADIELGRTTGHHHSGDIFRAEINIHIGGKTFRAVSEKHDLHSAIDGMKDEITRELSSHKEKRLSLLRRSGQRIKNLLRRFYK
ncbi:MAG: ribosome-associated translation inhibitor RaiA [Candidatus Taylorbacteria bacterium]|nr:ribosome-associated translation inhibitor RaiA [Candidatus Taylorbacteria bacterium]